MVNMVFFTINPSFTMIRQYEDPMSFTVMLRNDDLLFDVIHYPKLDRNNFNFTLTLSTTNLTSTSSRRKRATVTAAGPFLSNVTEDLRAGLDMGNNITFTGTINVMVSKQLCPNFNFLCLKMDPASEASFELYKGANNMICLNASAHKSCEGKFQ